MLDIMEQQRVSTQMVLSGSEVKHVYVDGGFCKNPVYMNMLASAFPDHQVYAASMANATALGAALAIHEKWNTKPVSRELITLKYYAATRTSRR